MAARNSKAKKTSSAKAVSSKTSTSRAASSKKTGTKTATTKSTTGAKALKAATKKTARPKKATAKSPLTRVTVRYDVGWDNAVFVRGRGATLSWNKGTKLKNVGANTWVWETRSKFTDCEFKVLINDTIYEEGANRALQSGVEVEVQPDFIW